MREEQRARRAGILKCRGELSARATAHQFGTTIAAVKAIWYDARPYTRKPVTWRCGSCGALATGVVCQQGHAAPWITDDERLQREITNLPPEIDECPED